LSNQFLLTVCNWLTIIGALFAFLCAIGRPHFGKKIDQEKDALHAQVLKTERAKVARLERESAVTRSLGAELQVKFQGDWKGKPFPLQDFSAVNQDFYVYLKNSQKSDVGIIKLHAAESYELSETQAGNGIFQARQNVKVGQFPLGEQTDILLAFDIVGIHIPFILYENFITPEITIEQVVLKFVLNGVNLNPVTLEQPTQVAIRTYEKNKSIAWASHEYTHIPTPWPQEGSTTASKP
jgi:hypothetical protein